MKWNNSDSATLGQDSDTVDYCIARSNGGHDSRQVGRKEHSHSYHPSDDTVKNHIRAKYRSRIDIASAILNAAMGGALKSRIASQAYVSSPQIGDYINMLIHNGMLHYHQETRTYYTTDKGRMLIRLYNESRQIFYHR